jgi:hypothetical protein
MKTLLTSLLLFIACCSVLADYSDVLSNYVDDNGMVNYAALSNDRKPLDDYIQSLENLNTDGWTEQDWIAFWINAYNARTLQVVIDHYPTEGIRKISGAWKKLKVPILGKERTLDEIEHKILRKEYKEPRIHMALVCAAKSCPKLRSEPYVGSRLDEQLADQSRDFLSRPSRFKVEGNTAYISQIFKWFKKDFESVPDFIKTYSGQDISGLKIKYQSYDWSLNEQEK